MFGYFRPVNKITQKCHSAKQGKDTSSCLLYSIIIARNEWIITHKQTSRCA